MKPDLSPFVRKPDFARVENTPFLNKITKPCLYYFRGLLFRRETWSLLQDFTVYNNVFKIIILRNEMQWFFRKCSVSLTLSLPFPSQLPFSLPFPKIKRKREKIWFFFPKNRALSEFDGRKTKKAVLKTCIQSTFWKIVVFCHLKLKLDILYLTIYFLF